MRSPAIILRTSTNGLEHFPCLCLGLLFFGASLIGVIIGPAYYMVGAIIQVYIFFKVVTLFNSHLQNFFNGANKPEYNIFATAIQQTIRIFIVFLLLVPFPTLGWVVLVLSNGIGWCFQFGFGLIIFYKKILKFRFNFWQSVGAPIIGAIGKSGYVYLLLTYVFPYLTKFMPSIVAAILGILFAIGSGIFVYFIVLSFSWRI